MRPIRDINYRFNCKIEDFTAALYVEDYMEDKR